MNTLKSIQKFYVFKCFKVNVLPRFCSTVQNKSNDEEFEIMPFLPPKRQKKKVVKEVKKEQKYLPRYKKMPVNQDWNSVWPAAKTFNPSVVPFPVYQGFLKTRTKLLQRPGKFANHELLKIPNFLHLSPPNVEKQCKALMKFCNPWPKGLETDEKIEKHFPIEIITCDYCHASPSIRNPEARRVILKINISHLKLDEHAKDKMIRILRERYDPKTGTITIMTESCPLKKQNTDYAFYLLTACFFESWKAEPWEKLKEPRDWERFFWHKSKSKEKIEDYFEKVYKEEKDKQLLEKKQVINGYEFALKDIFENGESDESLEKYRESIVQLMFG